MPPTVRNRIKQIKDSGEILLQYSTQPPVPQIKPIVFRKHTCQRQFQYHAIQRFQITTSLTPSSCAWICSTYHQTVKDRFLC
jgi:hypothetical protein